VWCGRVGSGRVWFGGVRQVRYGRVGYGTVG